jgi:CBS domain-containing protein
MSVNAHTPMADIMTTAPLAVAADCTVVEAERIMQRQGIRHLAVGHADGEISLVSIRDLQRVTAPAQRLDGDELTVGDVCEARAHVADASDPLQRVLAAMADEQIDAVLVMRDGELAGIFTTTDACRLFADQLGG